MLAADGGHKGNDVGERGAKEDGLAQARHEKSGVVQARGPKPARREAISHEQVAFERLRETAPHGPNPLRAAQDSKEQRERQHSAGTVLRHALARGGIELLGDVTLLAVQELVVRRIDQRHVEGQVVVCEQRRPPNCELREVAAKPPVVPRDVSRHRKLHPDHRLPRRRWSTPNKLGLELTRSSTHGPLGLGPHRPGNRSGWTLKNRRRLDKQSRG